MPVLVYYLMGFWICVSYMALYCFMGWCKSFELVHETKGLNWIICALRLKALIIYGMLFKSGRCASSSSIDWEIEPFESIC